MPANLYEWKQHWKQDWAKFPPQYETDSHMDRVLEGSGAKRASTS